MNSLTTSQLVSLVRGQWGQTASNGGGILDQDIVDYLNACQFEICADTDISVSGWTASTVAGQQQYSVPPEYSSVEAINLYQTTGGLARQWLAKVDITDIDPGRGTGNPFKFALWGLNVSGSNSLAFWLDPIPTASTVSPNDLTCFGRQFPQTMVIGGQGPEITMDQQYNLVSGALAKVYRRLGAGKAQYLNLAAAAEGRWQAAKAEAKSNRLMDIYKPGMARNTQGYGYPGYIR